MVPIYSINSWLVMVLPMTGLYLDSLREVYESFVIYSFMKYLLNFLKYDTNLQQYLDHKPGPSHIFPFCLLPNCVGGSLFMVRCKHGILQYVVVRPITTLIAFASKLGNFYGEGNYNPLSGYTYPVLLIVNNLSQISAMYCLVIFYTGYQKELAPMRPLAKFFSIKLVVFFSFFQSVVIAGLMEIEMIEQLFQGLFPELNDKVELGRKLQEFLICFDMLIAAIGHQFAFSHRPFVEDDDYGNVSLTSANVNGSYTQSSSSQIVKSSTCCEAFCNIFDFSDERSDVQEHFSQIFGRVRGFFKFRKPLPTIVSSNSSNPTQLSHLSDDFLSNTTNECDKSLNKNYQSID